MTDSSEKRPVGRPPSTIDERLLNALSSLAEKGASDKEIAEAAGISVRTFYRWKQTHPEFWHTLKESKEMADDLMEDSLYELGMSGNVTAQIFWLKNRRPERWRDVQKIDLTANVKHELPTREQALKVLTEDYAVLPAVDVEKK